MGIRIVAGKGVRSPQGSSRAPLFHRTLSQRSKTTLRRVRFSAGSCIGRIKISPRIRAQQRRQLELWIRRLPPSFLALIPPLKLATAKRLNLVGKTVLIDETAAARKAQPDAHMHAASYISEKYVVLQEDLFRNRIELGRILFHELCHFLWPRLGNPKRRDFVALLKQEFRQGRRGELGYSSEWRKKELWAVRRSQLRGLRNKFLWRDYVCESFCDTGAFVLLGSERRANHSEYTLSRAARKRRVHRWLELVLGDLADSRGDVPRKR